MLLCLIISEFYKYLQFLSIKKKIPFFTAIFLIEIKPDTEVVMPEYLVACNGIM